MRIIIYPIVTLVLFFNATSFVFANSSVDFGSCTLTPKESSETNPKIVGDTFVVVCPDVSSSNIYTYTWTNNFSEKVNQINFVFSSNGSNSYWHKNINTGVYTQNPFEVDREYSIGESVEYKIMLNPNSNISGSAAQVTLSFYNCDDNRIQVTCHSLGQQKIDFSSTTNIVVSEFNLSHYNLDFGEINNGDSGVKTFTINNPSNIDFVGKINKKSGSKDGFNISENLLSKLDSPDTITISANSSKNYDVTFNPTSNKDYLISIDFSPKDSVMARYVDTKTLVIKGRGTKVIEPLQLNITQVKNELVGESKFFEWKISGTGDIKNLPWKAEIATNCEGYGLANGGSFKWDINSIDLEKGLTLKNSLDKKWLNTPESATTITIIDSTLTNLKSESIQFPDCANQENTTPATPAGPSLIGSEKSENADNFSSQGNLNSSQLANQQNKSPQPGITIGSLKLEDLGKQELNFDKQVKGDTNENRVRGFWIRLLSFILVVAGVLAAVWYSKKEMLEKVIVISDIENDDLSKDAKDG